MDSDLSNFMYFLIVTSRLWLAANTAALSAGYGRTPVNEYVFGSGDFMDLCPILGLHKTHFVKFYSPRLKLCCDCVTMFNAARTKLREVT
jgi:hypothetical protein